MPDTLTYLDLAAGELVVFLLAHGVWLASTLVFGAGCVGLGVTIERRRRGGTRDQETAVAELARRCGELTVEPARLRDQLADAHRDRIMAEESASAYAHRAELQRARADAGAATVRELQLALTTVHGQLARLSRRDGEDTDDPDVCTLCGRDVPLPAKRDHLIQEHGADPADLVSLVRIPGAEVDPR